MYWVLILLLIATLFMIIKLKETRHRIGLTLIVLIILFFVISFGNVYISSGADLRTFDGVVKVTKTYFIWLGNIVKNLGKISGYAIKQGWGINATKQNISAGG